VGTSLGEFEQLILLALVRLGTDAYGVRMRKEIEARTGREISAGAIYTALERLEGRGFVSSHLGEPTPERGGRRKKYYRLEAAGAGALKRSYEAFSQMTKGLGPRLHALASDAKPKA
jgi:DNA-binding PadR family transcriptional regulator